LTEGLDGLNEWICTPFGIDAVCEAKITDVFQDKLIYVTTDQRVPDSFQGNVLM
jgi:hypothetical protein